MMTIIAIAADSKEIDVSGMRGSVEKHMSSGPRRVSKLEVEIYLPPELNSQDRAWLIKRGLACPVHKSVSQEMEVEVQFH